MSPVPHDAQPCAPIALVPAPERLDVSPGRCVLGPDTVIAHDLGGSRAARLLTDLLAAAPAVGAGAPLVRIAVDPGLDANPEAYRLDTTESSVSVVGASELGALHAVQSLRQLLPVDAGTEPWAVACVSIVDRPRLGWRGAMLDVARHFRSVEFVLRFLDLLALHKFNVLHLHLTDDQGWRLEIEQYPRLTEIGAWRAGTMVGHMSENRADELAHDGLRHGGYYTHDDIRRIVARADELGITVMPEIDLPGHSQAAIAAYPELGNNATANQVRTGWGISTHILNVETETLDFFKTVLDTVMDLFPSKYIHVGGDEVPADEWRESPAAQHRMQELGILDAHELEDWFIAELNTQIRARGRTMVGWEEIGDRTLPPGSVLMPWKNAATAIAAVQAGHDVIMAPSTHTYFDHHQGEDAGSEPLAIGGPLGIRKVYEFEPIPAELDDDARSHVLGSQFQLWSEYIPSAEHMEYMAFPRACAIAEVLWSADRDADDFFDRRLPAHLRRLDALGVAYRR